jgi:hypothetical protein
MGQEGERDREGEGNWTSIMMGTRKGLGTTKGTGQDMPRNKDNKGTNKDKGMTNETKK